MHDLDLLTVEELQALVNLRDLIDQVRDIEQRILARTKKRVRDGYVTLEFKDGKPPVISDGGRYE